MEIGKVSGKNKICELIDQRGKPVMRKNSCNIKIIMEVE